ncbi:MAG: MurR/RpiR family transcriptional regulator [Pseudomonadota bacterium]
MERTGAEQADAKSGGQTESGVLVRLRGALPSLNRAARQVADFILSDPERVIRLSVSEVAIQARVSDATVVRLARLIGLRGYQDLKITVARDLVSPLDSLLEDLEAEDPPDAVLRKVFAANARCLQDTLRVLDPAEVARAATLLGRARRVLVIGVGTSAPNAHDAANKLFRLGLSCEAETDGHLQLMKAALLAREDCVLAISHSGSTKDPIETLRVAAERGAATICITNNSLSPITKVARVRLVTASRETMYRSEAMSSRVAQATIIDALFTLVAMADHNRSRHHIKLIEDAIVVKQY